MNLTWNETVGVIGKEETLLLSGPASEGDVGLVVPLFLSS